MVKLLKGPTGELVPFASKSLQRLVDFYGRYRGALGLVSAFPMGRLAGLGAVSHRTATSARRFGRLGAAGNTRLGGGRCRRGFIGVPYSHWVLTGVRACFCSWHTQRRTLL